MTKIDKFILLAANEAQKSTQSFRHGAVIIGPGGKMICSGYNKGNRTKILDKIFTCTHAEIDALNKLINNYLWPKYGKNYKKYCKRYSIIVVRIENTTEYLKTAFSKPCYYCAKMLEQYGLKNVYYTLDETNIVNVKVENLDSTYKSDCQIQGDNVDTNIRLKTY